MSETGVAARSAEPVSLPAELPVRLYLRALRQYQKLIDLKRFASKEKVSDIIAMRYRTCTHSRVTH